MRCNVKPVLAAFGLLLFGGATTISQNDYLTYTTTKFPGKEGELVSFNYPWFGNFTMFLAMTFAGLLWAYEHMRDKKTRLNPAATTEDTAETEPLTEPVHPPRRRRRVCKCWQVFMRHPWCVLIFSSIFDLVASGLMSVSLSPCGVPASIYQMLNGSIIIFTALGAFLFFKTKPSKQQLIALAFCIAGISVVALSSYLANKYFEDPPTKTSGSGTGLAGLMRLVLKPHEIIRLSASDDSTGLSSASLLALGIGLVIISQVIYAGQFILEEYTMSRLVNVYPSQVVCIEGIYGFIMTVALTFPILMAAGVENDFDAFKFISVEPNVLLPIFIFFLCVALYNMFGQTITKLLSASHRTILEALRGLVVWIFGLLERAIFKKPWGEPLYGWCSAIEALGFSMLLVGSLMYYNIFKLRCLKEKRKLTDKEINPNAADADAEAEALLP